MGNNEIFKKNATVHGEKHAKKNSQEIQRKKILKNESFSMDEMETYELKRYMQLKKEIIGIKKGIYFGIFLFGFVTIMLTLAFLIAYNKKMPYGGNEFEYIKQKQQVLAKNQKLLNTKIFALNNYWETFSDKLNSKADKIFSYLKTQGKIIEILANIIMEDSVKLDKIIELRIETAKKNSKIKEGKNRNRMSVKKVKREIKEKSKGLIDKYKDLLKQLQ